MRWQTFVGPPELRVFHFTHVDNVPSLIESGALVADCLLRETARPFTEIGNPEIKARRRNVRVPVPPGGVVGDYVPFYFAPQSPMLFQVAARQASMGNKIQDKLIYLVSKVAQLRKHAALVVTDRNAATITVDFLADPEDLAGLIDWPLMRAQVWRDNEDELDRKERRMAELLVHEQVPLDAMVGLVTRSDETASTLSRYISGSSLAELPLRSYPQWYFDKQGW